MPRRITNRSRLRLSTSRHRLQEMSDRRYWNPDPITPLYGLNKTPTTLKQQWLPQNRNVSRPWTAFTPIRLGYTQPKRVLTCIRRKQRKEVLHALKKTGKGSGAKKHARWTIDSKYKC